MRRDQCRLPRQQQMNERSAAALRRSELFALALAFGYGRVFIRCFPPCHLRISIKVLS